MSKINKYALIILLLLCNQLCFTQSLMDSLLTEINKGKQDTSMVNNLIDLANEYKFKDPDSAFKYSNRALKLAEKLKWEIGIAESEQAIGSFYFDQANYTAALSCYFKALAIWERLEKTEQNVVGLKARSLSHIGNVYYAQGDRAKAKDYYITSLNMAERYNDKRNASVLYGNLGNVSSDNGQHEEALAYYFKGLKLYEEIGDTSYIAASYCNIALEYEAQNDYTKAMEYYSKALAMAESYGDKPATAAILGNIGTLYFEIERKDPKILKKEYRLAESYIQRTIRIYEEIGSLDGIRDFEFDYYKLDSARGNYDGAIEHYKKHIAARDSITNEENTKQQTRTEMQYEFGKKEARAKAEQEKRDTITGIIIYSISGGLLLVLLLVIFIFRSYRQKQKDNIIITLQKEEMEKQKHLVEEKQKEILDSIRYAKRIQNSLLPTAVYMKRSIDKLKGQLK